MPDLPRLRRLLSTPPVLQHDRVVLTYEERLLRRKRLTTERGASFMVDLPEVTNLDAFWGLELDDGKAIEIVAADEEVLSITGPDIARLAWHIGNRHTPCQIEKDRLVIRADHVLRRMLEGLGATVTPHMGPFRPEMGAYGTGRPMGHDHGHSDAQGHSHPHTHTHSHGPFGVHHHSSHQSALPEDVEAE